MTGLQGTIGRWHWWVCEQSQRVWGEALVRKFLSCLKLALYLQLSLSSLPFFCFLKNVLSFILIFLNFMAFLFICMVFLFLIVELYQSKKQTVCVVNFFVSFSLQISLIYFGFFLFFICNILKSNFWH